MSGDYTIVKANAQPGKDGVTALQASVQQMMLDGWQPAGGPFYDGALMNWCQAMSRSGKPAPAGEVPLREPGPVEQQPGSLRVHSDPKDGPMKMREPKP